MEKKINSLNILIIYLLTMIPIFLKPKLYFNLIYSIIPILIYLYYKLSIKNLIKSFIVSIIPSLSYLIMIILFAEENLKKGRNQTILFNLFGSTLSFKIYKQQIDYAISASLRIFLLSFISFTTTFMLDVWQLFKIIMEKKVISFSFCYAFSIALNSVSSILDEFKRVNFLMKTRKIRPFYKGFLPILIYGIRYSELAAISLFSRGFSEERTIFNCEKIEKNEICAFTIIGIIIMIMLFIRN